MLSAIVGALTSRVAGPAASAVALALALVAVGQCSEKQAEARRADRAEGAARLANQDLTACRGNSARLQAALNDQNASIEAAREEGDRRAQAAESALAEAERGRAATEARIKRLLTNPPAGIDACARMESADRNVMENLK